MSRRHRQALLDRGLTDEQIKAGLFFSVARRDRFQAGTPANLAGVVNGKIAASLPVMPVLPLIDMAMLRVGRPALITPRMGINIDGRKGRIKAIYRTGNYPITVAYPAIKRRESIGFCEGILKPRIAANRWNQRFIGGCRGTF
ncbi:MAG UNVERIFIED_CONTAM: hypothetical protein LVR29_31085 [Microcystis novacekii LVE1205-3]